MLNNVYKVVDTNVHILKMGTIKRRGAARLTEKNEMRIAYPSETNGPIRGMMTRKNAHESRRQISRTKGWKAAGYIARNTLGGMTMIRRASDRAYILRGNLTVFGSKYLFTL